MRMAKAPKEHVDRLRVWMQFNDLLMQIDPLYNREWMDFKMDWSEDEGYTNIIKELEDEEGNFSWEFYASYYQANISHVYNRILWGFEILVENVCDPELDYLDYNKELKDLLEKANKNQEHKENEQQ